MNIYFESLGCDKNTVDAQMMLGVLLGKGHCLVDSPEESDVAIVNTCGFIKDSQEESINTIIRLGEYKKEGNPRYIVAAGCLAQRYRKEIPTEMPEVDLIIGTNGFDKIGELIDSLDMNNHEIEYCPDINEKLVYGLPRILTDVSHYASLKIAEGCNKRCTYCAIPGFRGNYRSVPMEVLVKEAEELAGRGVRELMLVAQETTLYGTDIYGSKSLHILLEKLSNIEDIKMIRLLYCYPEEIYTELLEAFAKFPKVCHYIDMPVQSGADTVLYNMGRRTTADDIRKTVLRIREMIPDMVIRTTLISGFPGETEEDHRSTLSFVEEMGFDKLGVFTYSPEEGTKAAEMKCQLSEDVKNRRKDEIMELQQNIIFEKNKEKIGNIYSLIIDGYLPKEDVYIGRSYMDAPEVDGLIFVESQRELVSGDIVQAVIEETMGYDLLAREV